MGVATDVFQLVPSARWPTIGMMVLGIVAGLAETIGIAFVIATISSLVSPEDRAAIPGMSSIPGLAGVTLTPSAIYAVLFVSVCVKIGLALVNSFWTAKVENRINHDVRVRLHDQFLDASIQDLQRHDRGELITILATESYEVAGAHTAVVRCGVNVGTVAIFGLALFLVSWQVAALAAVAGAMHSLVMARFAPAFHRLGRDTSEVLESLTRVSWTALLAVKAVRAFGIVEQQRSTFADLSRQTSTCMAKVARYNALTTALSEAIVFAVLGAIVIVARLDGIPLASVITATVLLFRLQPHVREFDGNLLQLIKAETPIARARELVRTDNKRYLKGGDVGLDHVRSEIRLDNVTFAYDGAPSPVISKLSLSIPVGSNTAIVGRSGSGKTTLINLLLGLELPTSGRVLVDGIDLRNLRRSDWTRLTAVAGQDVELIEGTIAENIRFCRPVSMAQVRRAAELAGANRYIDHLPDGYDEWAGDEAMRLSGGQRQRLGVARGLVGFPEILILDEATNGLDEETEREVIEAVVEAFRDRTIILVTHRRSTVRFMDNVIDIEEVERQMATAN